MDLFELIIGLAAFFVIATFVILLMADVSGWFETRTTLYMSDADNIAVTVKEHWQSGNYKTVQGIFNTRTNRLADAHRITSQDVDDELKRLHENTPMVVYN